jgi:phenylacetate-CoA ligase
MSKIHSFLVRNLALPIYDIARGTSRFKFNRILEKTQWLPRHEIERLQIKNLRGLLKHAYKTVPLYHRIFKEKGFSSDDIKDLKDLERLPILTKADIRKHHNDLISQNYPRSLLVPRESGGTGDQIWFYVTKEQISWEVAAEFRAYKWANYHLGDRCLVFWGSPIDIPKSAKLIGQLTNALENVSYLNTYVLSDEVLDKYITFMKKFNPEVIRGYASSVYLLAKYVLEKGVKCAHPKAVITTAETLLDFQRKTIEDAFSCQVFDYYGSREIGSIAAECEVHDGYHISSENLVLECVKDGEQVSAGENGEILLTSLRNYGMPFIRYSIGDVGKLSDGECSCGRGLPLLASIEGRVSQFMSVFDKGLGKIIPVSTAGPGLFGGALMYLPIERYRIIQESLNKIIIIAVKGRNYSQRHTDLLIEHIHKFLGNNITLEIKFVNHLPPLPSGKRSVFISKINPFRSTQES